MKKRTKRGDSSQFKKKCLLSTYKAASRRNTEAIQATTTLSPAPQGTSEWKDSKSGYSKTDHWTSDQSLYLR